MAGPLAGLRVVEFSAIGPVPHCGMLLSDMGAEVLRIERAGGNGWPNPIVDRGRANLELDIRSNEGRATALEAIGRADVLLEGFRPGVMERLGLGPDVCLLGNQRLVYGRMTGWGQYGPLAHAAGHDINYIALTGALAGIGRPGEPAQPPLNLLGDFGGGSMFLAFGVLAALLERERSGKGQVIDAAIVDGVSHLMSFFAGLLLSERISLNRSENLLGGAAPFYRCYLCADGREVAVGPIEPHFYGVLTEALDAPAGLLERQADSGQWAAQAVTLQSLFLKRPAAEWCALLEGTDACFAPVLTLAEAVDHPHLATRGTYVDHAGLRQVAPAPRYSRTHGAVQPARDGKALLQTWSDDPPRADAN